MAWFQYESVYEKRERIERELKKRAARGEVLEPLQVPEGKRKIAHTFWGRSWCEHLESYHDYENRLPRGRSYLRQGSVFNLSVETGKIRAQVAGSSLYEVEITIKAIAPAEWAGIQKACAGQVGSLLDLLSGQLGSGLMEVISNKEHGLFPGPREIQFNCNCPDYASLCKHSCAVLYGVGVKFDADPALFFRLRGVDPAELLSSGADEALAPSVQAALEGEDLSALFGIDLGSDAAQTAESGPVSSQVQRKPAARKPAGKKPALKKPVVRKTVGKKTGAKPSPKKRPTA